MAGGLKYSRNLYPFLSVSAEFGYAGYSFLMGNERHRFDFHFVQSNISMAFHPFFKSSFKPLQSFYIGVGPGLNYSLGSKSRPRYFYPHDANWIMKSKVSAGISFNNFTISPYWVTFLTHFNDIDHGNFRYKEFLRAFGVSVSFDIIRKGK